MDPFNETPAEINGAQPPGYIPSEAPTPSSARSPLTKVSGPRPITFQPGIVVNSVHGLDRHEISKLSFDSVVAGAGLVTEQKKALLNGQSEALQISYQEMLREVWKEAQINGRDVGRDLQRILPDLVRDPELLERLYSVAKAETLLSVKVAAERRREFLSEIIVAAADRMSINQGHTHFCTVTDQLGDTSMSNVIKLMCGLALDCQVESRGGEKILAGRGMDLQSQSSDLQGRIIPFIEKKVGQSITSSGVSTLQLQQLGARQPGVIMSTLLACLMEINGQDVTKSQGQKWDGFTRTRQVIKGHEVVCAGYDAKIPVDRSGRPVWCHDSNRNENRDVECTKRVTLMEYIDITLARKELEGESSQITGIGVNMRWSDPVHDPNRQSKHACHTQSIIGRKVDDSGQVWYVLDNPVGDYYQFTGADQPPKRFAPGDVLGNQAGTWWKVGSEPGLVEVREDVLKNSLIHLMVDHPDRKFNFENTGSVRAVKVCTLGSVNGKTARSRELESLETHVPTLAEVPSAILSNGKSPVNKSGGYGPHDKTAGEWLAEKALEKRIRALRDASESVSGTQGHGHSIRKDPIEIADSLLEIQSAAQSGNVRWVGGKPNQPFLIGFSQRSTTEENVAVQGAPTTTPPPPPTRSPEELAQNGRQEKSLATAV
jgi:hypothetical protein